MSVDREPPEKKPSPGRAAAAPGAASSPGADATRDTSRAGAAESLADRPASAGNAAGSEASASAPEMFGRYRILKTLGQGAMGAVFLAEDTQLKRPVALKIPKFGERSGQSVLDRFYREARAAATLRHAHVCPVYDVGEIGGTHYLTMAFIEGKPLSEIIKKGKPITERQVAGVVRKLALGLQEAHAQGIVHRDLKPANIMIDRKGEPVVTDFGLARHLEQSDESRITQTGAILGTPAYMSPEQVEADPEKVGPASDVYSLGVILYELLTGQLPFQGPVTSVLAQIVSKTPARPVQVRPGLDAGLEAICLKMMARQPAERYGSMAEVVDALTAWLRGSSAAANPASTADGQSAAATRLTEAGTRAPEGDRLASLLESEAEAPQPPMLQRRTYALGGARRGRKPWMTIGIAAAAVVVVLLAVVVFVKTPTGTIKIELSDATAEVEVKVDGDVVSLTGLEEPLEFKAGEHELVVSGPKFETVTKSFTVKKGDNPVLRVSLEKKSPRGAGSPVGSKTSTSSGVDPDVAERFLASSLNDKTASTWPRDRWIALDDPDLTPRPWLKNLRFEKGVLDFHSDSWGIGFERAPLMRDATIRTQAKMLTPGVSVALALRDGPDGHYFGAHNHDGSFGIGKIDAHSKVIDLKKTAKGTPLAGFFELEFSAVGNRLTLKANGKTMVETTDSSIGRGRPRINAYRGRAQFKDLEVKILDAPAGDAKDGADDGWIDLFNGKDLTSWTVMKTSGANDDVHVAAPDGRGWKVQDGTLLCASSENGWLRSQRQYSDFVLQLEFKVPRDGNSDVYVRCPDTGHLSRSGIAIQIVDDRSTKLTFREHDRTGAIWRVTGPSAPVARPAGEWNSMEIRCEGARVQVTLNGTQVVDADINSYESLRSRPRSGYVGLSNWHGEANGTAFRNVRIRELGALPRTPLDGDGFVSLFNGKDLAGWSVATGEPGVWMVKDGDLIGTSGGRAKDHWLLTDKDYGNFVLRFEYRLRQGANASGGITFRTLATDPRGPLKLMDDDSRSDWSVKEGERTGTLWARGKMAPPQPAKLRGGDQWNAAEVTLDGTKLTLSINGALVQNLDLSEFAKLAGDFPTLTRASGRIGLQSHTSIIRFRNIRLRPLPPTATTAASDSSKPDSAAKTAERKPPPRIEVTDDPAWPRNKWIALEIPDVKKFNWLQNPRYEAGILEFRSDGGGFGFPPVPMSRNIALRAQVKPLERSGNVGLSLRDGPDGGLYAFYNPNGGLVGFTNKGKTVNVKPFKDFFEFELSAIDEKITIKLDGKKVLEVTDTQSSRGWPGINAWKCRAQFKKLEVKLLDELSAEERNVLALGAASGERRGGARILQHKLHDWPNSKTDYARFDDPLIEVGLGSEAPGWGWGATGIEIDSVRRIKFALTTTGLFKQVGDDPVDCGFKIDYHTPAGYTKRVALSLWNKTPKKYVPVPPWGQGKLPDQVETIGLRRAYDLDLAKWAPPDWDGQVWFNVMTQNTGRGTRLLVHLLELERRE